MHACMHGPMGPPGVLPSALTIGCNRLRGQAALQSTKGAASETAHGDLLASRGHPHRVSSRISTARLAWHARYTACSGTACTGSARHALGTAHARHGTLGMARHAQDGTPARHTARHATLGTVGTLGHGTGAARHARHGTLSAACSAPHGTLGRLVRSARHGLRG